MLGHAWGWLALLRGVLTAFVRGLLANFVAFALDRVAPSGIPWDESRLGNRHVAAILGCEERAVSSASVRKAPGMLGYGAAHRLVDYKKDGKDRVLFCKRATPGVFGRFVANCGFCWTCQSGSLNLFFASFVSSLGRFENEGLLYQHIAPTLHVRTPRVALARSLLHSDFQIFSHFEDSLNTIDVTQWKKARDVDDSLVEMAVRTMARLHSAYMGQEAARNLLRRFPWLGHHSFTYFHTLPALFSATKRGFQVRFGTEFPEKWRQLGLSAAFDQLQTEALARRINMVSGTNELTLIHGDFRLGNMLWDSSQEDPMLLDFSNTCVESAAGELAYWMTIDLPVDYRQKHFDWLVGLYVDSIKEHGIEVDYKSFKDDVKMSFIRPLATTVVAHALLPVNSKAEEDQWREWVRRMAFAVEDYTPLREN
jgi:Ecdysteroid kinase-like family